MDQKENEALGHYKGHKQKESNNKMATQYVQRVLVTGATGFLGSRITYQLLKQTKMTVIGTTSQLEWKGNKLR